MPQRHVQTVAAEVVREVVTVMPANSGFGRRFQQRLASPAHNMCGMFTCLTHSFAGLRGAFAAAQHRQLGGRDGGAMHQPPLLPAPWEVRF